MTTTTAARDLFSANLPESAVIHEMGGDILFSIMYYHPRFTVSVLGCLTDDGVPVDVSIGAEHEEELTLVAGALAATLLAAEDERRQILDGTLPECVFEIQSS
jgi:hypothetical protein